MSKPGRSAIDQIELMRNALAITLCGGFVGMIPLFVFKAIPTGNEQLITYMLGQLSGMALTALSFYFVNKVGADALDAKRADNTKAAMEAIKAAATGGANADEPQKVEVTNDPANPVPTTNEGSK